MPHCQRLVSLTAGLLAVAVALSACATTRQTRRATASGFLKDYTVLEAGEKDQAQLRYVSDEANLGSYSAVLLDSVTVWHSESTGEIPEEDQQKLADHLYAALHKELGKSYRIVDHPAPGTLRVRAAITEAKGARVAGNVITTVVPQLRMLSTLAGMATNTQTFVGKAAIEVELRDAVTNALLAAAVDERAGAKTLRTMTGTWKDAEAAFDAWAEQLSAFLAAQRG